MAKKNTQSPAPIRREDLRGSELAAPGEFAGLAGFVPAEKYVSPTNARVVSMAPMIKPAAFPVGVVLVGKFAKIFATKPGKNDDGSDKTGEGVEIMPDGAKVGIALPAVAVLKRALEITGSGDNATSPLLGKTVAIQKLAEKIPSKKGNSAWNFIVEIHD